MTRLKRLQTVEGVLGDKADRAARELGEVREQLRYEQERLEQLQQFRDEYQDRLSGSGATSMDAFRLRDFNAFLARIDAAMAQQREQVREVEQKVEHARRRWDHERSQAEAMGKVVARQQADEQRRVERREQSDNDELAQRLFTHNRRGRP